jgi:hypothetical protein
MAGVDDYLRFRPLRLQAIEHLKAVTILQAKVKDENIHAFGLCSADRGRT